MTVKQLKEKLKNVSDYAKVQIRVDNPDPIYGNSGGLYDYKEPIIEISSDSVVFKGEEW